MDFGILWYTYGKYMVSIWYVYGKYMVSIWYGIGIVVNAPYLAWRSQLV
jgi:hypothetical protein